MLFNSVDCIQRRVMKVGTEAIRSTSGKAFKFGSTYQTICKLKLYWNWVRMCQYWKILVMSTKLTASTFTCIAFLSFFLIHCIKNNFQLDLYYLFYWEICFKQEHVEFIKNVERYWINMFLVVCRSKGRTGGSGGSGGSGGPAGPGP